MRLDYRPLIYASICNSQWRHANVEMIETEMLRKHGVLGHMSVQEFRTEAVILAQRQIESRRSSGPACNYCDDRGTIIDGAGDRYACENCR